MSARSKETKPLPENILADNAKIWHTFFMSGSSKLFKDIISCWLIVAFLGLSVYVPQAQAEDFASTLLRSKEQGILVHLSPAYIPAHLMGMSIHTDNPLKFDFLIHKGDGSLSGTQKKQEYTRLVKYFLASLTIPDKDQWVNLSPYEHNRIIADNFGKTEMGHDLLGQDYLLKQMTSSLMYPESGLGKSFWNEVYSKAWTEFHTTNIPVNTFNKVWIVPDQATVYESGNTAYIIQSHLKVMLEEDYLSLSKHVSTSTHTIGSQVIREIILPALEKEVNEGKNFAQLRQIVSGMILATWYKRALKESLLGKIYADKGKVKGVDQDPRTNEEIYQQYLKAFKKGVYNYIKEDEDKYTHQSIPRKYFSGGFNRAAVSIVKDIPDNLVLTVRDEWANAAMVIDRAMVNILPSAQAANAAVASRRAMGQRLKGIMAWVSSNVKSTRRLPGTNIVAFDYKKEGLRRLAQVTIENINAKEQSQPKNVRNYLIETVFNSYVDRITTEDAPAFAQVLNEEWRASGFNERYGPLFDWIVLSMGAQGGSVSRVKYTYQWIYRFLEGGSPLERAFGLWLLVVGNVSHLREQGLHPESDKKGGRLIYADNNLIIGDGLNPGILREYIQSILRLNEMGELTEVLSGPDGNPNTLGLTPKDFLLWGLVLAADPSIHAPFEYFSDAKLHTLQDIFGKDMTFDKVMVKSLEKAFSHIPKNSLKEIQPLLMEAFSVTDEQWAVKGFKSPYFYGSIDFINNLVRSDDFQNDVFWQTYPLMDRFKMFPFLRKYLPAYKVVRGLIEARDIFEIDHDQSIYRNLAVKQNPDGLRKFYAQTFTSRPLAVLLPDVAAVFDKEKQDAAMQTDSTGSNAPSGPYRELDGGSRLIKITPNVNAFINRIKAKKEGERLQGAFRITFSLEDLGIIESFPIAGMLNYHYQKYVNNVPQDGYVDVYVTDALYRKSVPRIDFKIRKGISSILVSINPSYIIRIEKVDTVPEAVFKSTMVAEILQTSQDLPSKEAIMATLKNVSLEEFIRNIGEWLNKKPLITKLIVQALLKQRPGIINFFRPIDPYFKEALGLRFDAAMSGPSRLAERFSEIINQLSRSFYPRDARKSGLFRESFRGFLDEIDRGLPSVVARSINRRSLVSIAFEFHALFQTQFLLDYLPDAMEVLKATARRSASKFSGNKILLMYQLEWDLVAAHYLKLVGKKLVERNGLGSFVRVNKLSKGETAIVDLIHTIWVQSMGAKYAATKGVLSGYYHDPGPMGLDTWEQVAELLKYINGICDQEEVMSFLSSLDELSSAKEMDRPRHLEIVVPTILMTVIPLLLGKRKNSILKPQTDQFDHLRARLNRLVNRMNRLIITKPNGNRDPDLVREYERQVNGILEEFFVERHYLSFSQYSSNMLWGLREDLRTAQIILEVPDFYESNGNDINEVINYILWIEKTQNRDFSMTAEEGQAQINKDAAMNVENITLTDDLRSKLAATVNSLFKDGRTRKSLRTLGLKTLLDIVIEEEGFFPDEIRQGVKAIVDKPPFSFHAARSQNNNIEASTSVWSFLMIVRQDLIKGAELGGAEAQDFAEDKKGIQQTTRSIIGKLVLQGIKTVGEFKFKDRNDLKEGKEGLTDEETAFLAEQLRKYGFHLKGEEPVIEQVAVIPRVKRIIPAGPISLELELEAVDMPASIRGMIEKIGAVPGIERVIQGMYSAHAKRAIDILKCASKLIDEGYLLVAFDLNFDIDQNNGRLHIDIAAKHPSPIGMKTKIDLFNVVDPRPRVRMNTELYEYGYPEKWVQSNILQAHTELQMEKFLKKLSSDDAYGTLLNRQLITQLGENNGQIVFEYFTGSPKIGIFYVAPYSAGFIYVDGLEYIYIRRSSAPLRVMNAFYDGDFLPKIVQEELDLMDNVCAKASLVITQNDKQRHVNVGLVYVPLSLNTEETSFVKKQARYSQSKANAQPTIVILEDDAVLGQLLQRDWQIEVNNMFGEGKVGVQWAKTVKYAREILESYHVALVVADTENRGSQQWIDFVRKRAEEGLISSPIFGSSKNSLRSSEWPSVNGFVGVLAKPYGPDDIHEALFKVAKSIEKRIDLYERFLSAASVEADRAMNVSDILNKPGQWQDREIIRMKTTALHQLSKEVDASRLSFEHILKDNKSVRPEEREVFEENIKRLKSGLNRIRTQILARALLEAVVERSAFEAVPQFRDGGAIFDKLVERGYLKTRFKGKSIAEAKLYGVPSVDDILNISEGSISYEDAERAVGILQESLGDQPWRSFGMLISDYTAPKGFESAIATNQKLDVLRFWAEELKTKVVKFRRLRTMLSPSDEEVQEFDIQEDAVADALAIIDKVIKQYGNAFANARIIEVSGKGETSKNSGTNNEDVEKDEKALMVLKNFLDWRKIEKGNKDLTELIVFLKQSSLGDLEKWRFLLKQKRYGKAPEMGLVSFRVYQMFMRENLLGAVTNELVERRIEFRIQAFNETRQKAAAAAAIEDAAMSSDENPGGIDLNSANLNLEIKRDGRGVPLPLADQDMAQLSRIQGFEPEIIDIRPAADLPILRELQQKLQSASVVSIGK